MDKQLIKQYFDDPEGFKMIVREYLKDERNRRLIKKRLRNRAERWMLKKSGALEIVQEELRNAEHH